MGNAPPDLRQLRAEAWVRDQGRPDYGDVRHAAHVSRGVGCVEDNGRIDKREGVYQHETLSMGWCLECHRDPVSRVRDPALVTNLGWGADLDAEQRREVGQRWMDLNQLAPSQNCSTCHR